VALLEDCPNCKEPMAAILVACAFCGAPLPARTPRRQAEALEQRLAAVSDAALERLRTGSRGASLLAGFSAAGIVACLGASEWIVLDDPKAQDMGGRLYLLVLILGCWLIGRAVESGGWRGRRSARAASAMMLAAIVAGKFIGASWFGPEIVGAWIKQGIELDPAVRALPPGFALAFTLTIINLVGTVLTPSACLFFLGAPFVAGVICTQYARRYAALHGAPEGAPDERALTPAEFDGYRSGSLPRSAGAAAAMALACAGLWLGILATFDRMLLLLLALPASGILVGWAAAKGGWQGRKTQAVAAAAAAAVYLAASFLHLYWISALVAQQVLKNGTEVAERFLHERSLTYAAQLYPMFLKNSTKDNWGWALSAIAAAWFVSRLCARSAASDTPLDTQPPAA